MKALTWVHLMHKRTLKRPAFWVILLLIPLLTGALSAVKKDAGIVAVSLYLDGGEDEARRIAARLDDGTGVVRVQPADSPEEARRRVEEGTSDAAWILTAPADTAKAYAEGKGFQKILVIERESNVFLALARERLFSALLPEIEREVFAKNLLALGRDPAPDEREIDAYYRSAARSEELVEFVSVDGTRVDPPHYLPAPVRGLLALLIGAVGMASAVYFAGDEENGLFFRLTPVKKALLAPAAVFMPMLDLAAASYLALTLAGLVTAPLREALALFLYTLAACGLCTLLWALLRSPKALSLATLFFVLATLILTPVFLQIARLETLSALLPSYHYLLAAHTPSLLWRLPVYAAAALLLAFPPALLRRRRP